MKNYTHKFKTVIIGGGPAGTGLIISAIRKGVVKNLLEEGIAIVEQSQSLGCGDIGKYLINSDSHGGVFLECLHDTGTFWLNHLEETAAAKFIKQREKGPIPLKIVGEYLKETGSALMNIIQRFPASKVFTNTLALEVRREDNGVLNILLKDKQTMKEFWVCAESVVFAIGGEQSYSRILNSRIGENTSLSEYGPKIILTETLFVEGGISKAESIIKASGTNKVVVIGGSHSAFSSLSILLEKMPWAHFANGDITLMHRDKLKLFYLSIEEAIKDGYTDFTENDICPNTQRVYRMGGMRMESKELLRNLFGLGNEREERVHLLMIADHTEEIIKQKLNEASLIIPAFGYLPKTIPFIDEFDQPVEFSLKPRVNKYCQILDKNGCPLPNLFGIGLASGFLPWGKLAGEKSFRGQTNSLWAYQHGVGEMIISQIISSVIRHPAD